MHMYDTVYVIRVVHLQVIKVRGYTVYEKVEIATRHLMPKLIEVGRNNT